MNQTKFKKIVWDYYHHAKRDLPWRPPRLAYLADGTLDPYRIMVSEVMLQQTQVLRVVPKYTQFLKRFPDVSSLAKAKLGEVLEQWSGLGYNRRAKFLWQAANEIVTRGSFPRTIEELAHLPGIGENTAGAILSYSFNSPEIFIETNIRTVFLHYLFPKEMRVADSEILPLVAQTLDTNNPRDWYYALMDLGSFLKKRYPNPGRRSKHHVKQSTFVGSRRQLRGQILKQLLAGPALREDLLRALDNSLSEVILDDLIQEGLVSESGLFLQLGSDTITE